jgi:Uma2 family endonuclease
MSTATQTPLMTGDEFLRLYGDQSEVELVDGQIRRLPTPGLLHGEVCFNAANPRRGHTLMMKNVVGLHNRVFA